MSTVIEKKKANIAAFFNDPARKNQIAGVLPKIGLTADRMVRCLFSAFIQTPALFECTTESLYKAVIQCSALGLEPNTPLHHCVMIPFNNRRKNCKEVQLIIEYRGWIALARRSKDFFISADVVKDGDYFEFEKGTTPFLRHRPERLSHSREITHAYSVLRFPDGSFDFEVITKETVDEHRVRSKSSNEGPWVTDYAMMARKTAILVHQRYWPVGNESLALASKIDGENSIGIQDVSGIIDTTGIEFSDDDKPALNAPKTGSIEDMARQKEKPSPPPQLTPQDQPAQPPTETQNGKDSDKLLRKKIEAKASLYASKSGFTLGEFMQTILPVGKGLDIMSTEELENSLTGIDDLIKGGMQDV